MTTSNLTADQAANAILRSLPSYTSHREAKTAIKQAAFSAHFDELLAQREAGNARYTGMIVEDLERLAWKKAAKIANALLENSWFV